MPQRHSAHLPRIGVVGIPGAWSSVHLADAVERATGFRLLVDLSECVADISTGTVWSGDFDLGTLDLMLVKKVGSPHGPHLSDRLALLHLIEACGVRVLSSPRAIARLISRLACTVELRCAGIEMPETHVCESVDAAAEQVRRIGSVIVKPLYSSRARGMLWLRAGDPELVPRLTEFQREHGPQIYVQRKLELPGRDLGLAFVGGEHVGTYARMMADGAWDTTTQSGGKYAPFRPPAEYVELAQRAMECIGLDFGCVDLAETPDGPLVFEVSAFGGFRGCLEAAGVDMAERIVAHALGLEER